MPHQPPDGDDRTTRVPPHDPAAERALLAAQLQSAAAIAAVAELVTPTDYYRPAHTHIARAIQRIHQRGDPVDAVTVADQLGRDGHPPGDPGPDGTPHWASIAGLVDLMAAGVGTHNAPTWARIVADHARRRAVIAAAAQLLDDAWTSDDPGRTVTDHRARLDELGDTLTAGSNLHVADIAAILDGGQQGVEPDLLVRTDGQALLYAGHMHTLQAAPSTGKSWIALTAVAQVIGMGGTAVYLDWEDSGIGIVTRLLALGAHTNHIRQRFAYARADGSWTTSEHTVAHQLLDQLNPDLVIIDGVAEAMAHDGLDENVAADWMSWVVRVPRPLAATGAAVLMLDHTKKDSDKTDRYARGSGAKLAAIDGAAYRVDILEPYSRSRAGSMRLTVTKDRHGGIGAVGENVAHLNVKPTGHGHTVRIHVDPPPVDTAADGHWMPTRIMVRVSAILEGGPASTDAIHRRLAKTSREIVTQAITELIELGHIARNPGPGATPVLTLIRPYHGPDAPQADPDPDPDPDPDDPDPEPVQGHLQLVPDPDDPDPGF